MEMCSFPSWICTFLFLATIHVRASDASDDAWYDTKTRLTTKLSTNSDPDIWPLVDSKTPLDVSMRMVIRSILDVDEREGFIKIHLWYGMTWQDERLAWDPSEFGNISRIHLPKHLIWNPDICIFNGLSDPAASQAGWTGVREDGKVMMAVDTTVTALCQMQVSDFPKDEQVCQVKFNSFTYNPSKLRLFGLDSQQILTNKLWHADWETLNVSISNKTIEYPSEPPMYYEVHLDIRLRRRATFFQYVHVVPPVLVSLLVPLSFLLHPTGPHRCILGSGLIMSMCFLIGSFEWLMPTGEGGMPRLGAYYIGGLVTAVLSMMTFVLLGVFSQRSQTGTKPPELISKVIGDKLAYLMCVSRMPAVAEVSAGEGSSNDVVSKPTEPSAVTSEWLHLTSVLDRVFFIAFTFIYAIMSFYCLI